VGDEGRVEHALLGGLRGGGLSLVLVLLLQEPFCPLLRLCCLN
jgi:hypothetical protein